MQRRTNTMNPECQVVVDTKKWTKSVLSSTNLLALALAMLLGLFATPSHAILISGLYNTGVDAFGNALPPATGNAIDPHYTILLSPSGPLPAVTVDETQWPLAFGPWVPNTPGSKWIGPSAAFGLGPPGNYTYRTQFFLPATATIAFITGLWATDDPSVDIYLNGVPQLQSSAGFTSLVPFGVTTGFNFGVVNFLDFVLTNAGGPTGLRVEAMSGHYYVPEPTSAWIGLSAGLGVAVGIRRQLSSCKRRIL